MRQISEAETRKELIDPALERARWYLHDHARVKTEIPVVGYEAAPWNGVTDYCLYRSNGEVLAVVEAKRTSHNPSLAQAQTEYYVSEIEKHQPTRPFAFMTNGLETYFLEVGVSAKRPVADMRKWFDRRKGGAGIIPEAEIRRLAAVARLDPMVFGV